MKNLLIYYNFIIITTFVLLALFSARTTEELIAGALFSPLLVYFMLLILPQQTHVAPTKKVRPKSQNIFLAGDPEPPTKLALDIDRRLFLKFIGATGISLFLFSLFSKKDQMPFLGKLNAQSDDTAGSKPTDSYRISEIDEGIITFYGFTKDGGAWFIMKEDTGAGSFRYARGGSGFPDAWARREQLQYDYYHNIF